MNLHLQQLMQKATQLTRGGKLQAATAAIQAFLRGKHDPEPASTPEAPAAKFTDVDFREVPAQAPRQPAAPPFTNGFKDVHEQAPRRPETSPFNEPAFRGAPDQAPPRERGREAPGRFTPGRFSHGGASREFKLYVPPGAGREPLPLVVMLHGCTQDPDDFAAGTAMNEVARAKGFYVLYPAQSRGANPQGCWNWFKHNHQQRGRGEPALLAGMTRQVMAQHAIDPRRVYVAGLSAGGAMAAILGCAYPELFAAVGVHSGLAAGSANDLPSLTEIREKEWGSPASLIRVSLFSAVVSATRVSPSQWPTEWPMKVGSRSLGCCSFR